MALPNRSRAWRTSITSVTGSATSTQTFSLGSVNGRPTLPFTAAVVKRGQDANPGTHEEITITAMTGSAVTACTRAVNTTSAIALEVGDSIYGSVAALVDAIESSLGSTFVVDGVAYPATRAGVQAAVTAAAVAGGVVDVAVNVTFDNTTVTVPIAGNVTLRGRPGVKLKAPTTGACVMFTPSGTGTATSTLSANAARGALTVSHNQTGGLTFAAGEYIKIANPVGAKGYAHITRVESVAGAAPQVVTIADPLPEAFTTADVCTVDRPAMIPNLVFENLDFDNNGNTSAVRAVIATNVLDFAMCNCTFTGFKGSGVGSGDSAGGVSLVTAYRPVFDNVRFIDCGTRGLAALQNFQTSYAFYDHVTFLAGGFGFSELGSSNPTLRAVKTAYNNGRSIGIGGPTSASTFGARLYDCHADHALSGETGISIRGSSAYVWLYGCGAIGNEAYGLWTEGAGEHDIHDFGGEYLNNNKAAVGATDVLVASATNYNFEFWGAKYASKADAGIGTKFNGCIYQATGSAVVNNNTEQITFTLTVAPGQLTIYNALRLRFDGIIQNNAGNRTIDIAVKYGGTTLYKDTTAVLGASANNRPFAMDLMLRNVAVTNDQRLTGTIAIGGVAGATTGSGDLGAAGALAPAPVYGTAAEDSTAAKALVITVTMSANDFSFVPVNAVLEVVG